MRGPLHRVLGVTAEAAMVVTAITYAVTGRIGALLCWEALVVSYLAVGLAVTWAGSKAEQATQRTARSSFRWGVDPPGDVERRRRDAAVMGLLASQALQGGSDTSMALVAVAAVGIIASWALLHVGFAQIYWAADTALPSSGIDFPSEGATASLDYLYFSFTVGTSFATSDATVTAIQIRRIVLLHSVVSFFYNALVVAVAFQVLQTLART